MNFLSVQQIDFVLFLDMNLVFFCLDVGAVDQFLDAFCHEASLNADGVFGDLRIDSA